MASGRAWCRPWRGRRGASEAPVAGIGRASWRRSHASGAPHLRALGRRWATCWIEVTIRHTPRCNFGCAWLAIQCLKAPIVRRHQLLACGHGNASMLRDRQYGIELRIAHASAHDLDHVKQPAGSSHMPHTVVNEEAIGGLPASIPHNISHQLGLVPVPESQCFTLLAKDV